VRGAVPGRSWADFDAFYREHFRFVWRIVRRLGIDGHQVDDAVQDVFLVVHRRLGDFEGRSAAKTWLYGIVRRVVADHRRTLRRKPGHDTAAAPPESDLDAITGGEPSPQASVEQAERVRLLHRLLGELDEDKCEVFILSELEGLTMAEIAEALDVNANTIASRLRAARREFEAALDRATRADDAIDHGIEERRSR
jgi:RNA polymerase sigma-70 factor (ECF subfamily)